MTSNFRRPVGQRPFPYKRRRENPGKNFGLELCAMGAHARESLSNLRIVLNNVKCEANVVSFNSSSVGNDFIRIMNDLEKEMNEKYKATDEFGFSANEAKVTIRFRCLSVFGYNNLIAASEFAKTLTQGAKKL